MLLSEQRVTGGGQLHRRTVDPFLTMEVLYQLS